MFQIQKRNETALNPNEERALRSFNSQTRNETLHCQRIAHPLAAATSSKHGKTMFQIQTRNEVQDQLGSVCHWPQELVGNTEKLCSRCRYATKSWTPSSFGRNQESEASYQMQMCNGTGCLLPRWLEEEVDPYLDPHGAAA